jgi:starch phosphorylase
MVALTLLHSQGYFFQRLDAQGRQSEEPVAWSVDDFVRRLPTRVALELEGRNVQIAAWEYEVTGLDGFVVPVYLLDTDLAENDPVDRRLTQRLYGGDHGYRLCQEAVLGIGGVRMLRALGHVALERFHMNEGHSSLLAIELLQELLTTRGGHEATPDDVREVRRRCVFTTHTPVPAGHDQFPLELADRVLGTDCSTRLRAAFGANGTLNMTKLALDASHYVNGVAKSHGEVSRQLFPTYRIDWITNGVHAPTWTAPSIQRLFDRYVPGWREDNFSLRSALSIPDEDLRRAHREAKWRLLELVNRVDNVGLDLDHLTLGLARRATPYKRLDLIFSDSGRLKDIVERSGPLQIVCGGKAHPHDDAGKRLIERIFAAQSALRDKIKVAYLPNYDFSLAKLLVAGVDVWLNTPQPPLEASGTSGMKAALNGVPSLSVLDGWWIEGCIEGFTGWAIGAAPGSERDPSTDAAGLYDKLENVVYPSFYAQSSHFANVMRHAIALNGAYFNTQRMVQQYLLKAYYG